MTLRALATGRGIWLVLLALVAAVSLAVKSSSSSRPDPSVVAVTRGTLAVTLTETGTLRPAEALVYRSRVPGRELEIVWLAAEGVQVKDGDLLVRLDTTELAQELERANQAARQAQLDEQVAEAESRAAASALESVSTGRGALDSEEARFNLESAERRAGRLKEEYDALQPLLDKGYVTREELQAMAGDLQQAQAAVELARRRVTVIVEQTVPQERERAALDVAHRTSQIEAARQRLAEAGGRVRQWQEAIESCAIRAQHGGLVVYEDSMTSNPRRKIRVGDRVTPSQGLITIPEVKRMLVDTSLREADLHRVRTGQRTVISLDAYPDVRLTGHVLSVGTVARAQPERPYDGKRFDVVVDVDPNTADLRPEMTARVVVQVAERAAVLMVPVNAVFEQNGQRAVRVVNSRGVEVRVVELGQSNDFYVEVLKGLNEGDRVRLSES